MVGEKQRMETLAPESVQPKYLVLDGETSIKNKGNPFTASNFLVSFAWGVEARDIDFSYYREPDFLLGLQLAINESDVLVGVNLKFDLQWLRKNGITIPKHVRVWDCSLAEHIMSGQKSIFPSMNSMCESYGIRGKEGGLEEFWNAGISTEDIDYNIVKDYNVADITRTWEIFCHQQKDKRLDIHPNMREFILLDGDDMLVLADMEYNGIKYDMEGSKELAETYQKELKEIDEYLYDIAGTDRINLDSGDHLSAFLFGGRFTVVESAPETRIYKSGPNKGLEYTTNRTVARHEYCYSGFFTPPPDSELAKSKEGARVYSTADGVLQQVKCSTKIQRTIIENLKRRAELSKIVDTYLKAFPEFITNMEWGDYLHGQYNQVIVATGRLSSSKPNLQNTPPIADQMLITRF